MRITFYALMLSASALFVFLTLEFIAPVFIKAPHQVYRFWGARPVTYYPDMTHRAIRANYDVSFRSNSLGFKDTDHEFDKPDGTYRLLLLGDSYVEGAGVAEREQMGRVMERMAGERGVALEVISMGMSGWGQAHHLATYETLGRKFSPDMVITFFCSNDFEDNLKDENTGYSRPIYEIRQGKLVSNLDQAQREESVTQKLKRLFLYRFESYFILRYIQSLIYQRFFVPERQRKSAHMAASGSVEPGDLANGDIPVAPNQRKLFKLLVKKMKREVVDMDKAELLNVIVSSDVTKAKSPRFLKILDWVEKVYLSQGIDTINLERVFTEKYTRTGQAPCWKTDSHWNARGHLWVARELIKHILGENAVRRTHEK